MNEGGIKQPLQFPLAVLNSPFELTWVEKDVVVALILRARADEEL